MITDQKRVAYMYIRNFDGQSNHFLEWQKIKHLTDSMYHFHRKTLKNLIVSRSQFLD